MTAEEFRTTIAASGLSQGSLPLLWRQRVVVHGERNRAASADFNLIRLATI